MMMEIYGWAAAPGLNRTSVRSSGFKNAARKNCFIPPAVAALVGNSIKSASVPCYMFYAQLISKTNALIR